MTTRGDESGGTRAEVQAFLDRLAKALTAGDGQGVAELWGYPALVVGADMVQAVATPDEVARFFGGAKAQYNAKGITDTRGDIQRLDTISEGRVVVVDVRWPYLDGSGRELGSESSSYVLRRDEGGRLRLHAAVMRGVSG